MYTQHIGQISVLPFWWQCRSMVWTGGPPTDRRHIRKGCKKSGLWHYYITTLNYLSFISAHLKSVSIILYEVIVHCTDHPFVFIQDLCLQIEGRWNIKIPVILSPRDFFERTVNMKLRRLTGCILINQPVFSPGSFIRSKPKRASISSVNWLRSSRLRADIDEPSSLIQTEEHNNSVIETLLLKLFFWHSLPDINPRLQSNWGGQNVRESHWFSWSPPLCPRSALYRPLFCRTMFQRGLP